MGFLPPSSPLAHQTSIELQDLGKLLGTPVGMGMSSQDNLCASSHGLGSPMGLDEMKELLDLIGSQLKRRQWGARMQRTPPSLVGKPSHLLGHLCV